MNYNDDQKKVIAFGDGANLVSAGPGSGKTRVVVSRIARMVKEGVDPHSILATTFTKKAAEEMNERLRTEGVNTGRNGVSVKTMHGFCLSRIIRPDSNIATWEVTDGDELYKTFIKMATGYKGMDWKGVDVSNVAAFISLCKNSLIRPEQSQTWEGLMAHPFNGDQRYCQAYFETEELRRQRKMLTFDDMLIDAVEILETDESIANRIQGQYKYIIIDEFQDSNLAQLRLIELVAKPQLNLMAVGDTDQSIYEFRGAVPKFMLEFSDRYNASIISMGTNYRCAPNIMDAAAKCIANNKLRIPKELVANKTEQATIRCKELIDLDTEACSIADEIQMLHEDGTPYGQMYVLYRTNAQSRAIEEEFCRRKLPHIVLGAASFYQRKEIQDLLAYLKLVDDPFDGEAGARALNRPFRFVAKKISDEIEGNTGHGTTFIQAAQNVIDSGRGGYKIKDFITLMIKLQEMAALGAKPGAMLSTIVKDSDYFGYLQRNEGSDTAENSRVANVGEFIRAADRYEDIAGLVRFVAWQINQRKKNNKKNAKNSDVITAMTIHKAKGLEAQAVFVIGCNEGILPHANAPEDCEEERRLFYVAITRAMEYLWVSCVQQLGLQKKSLSPSRFFRESHFEIEEETKETSVDNPPNLD